MLEAPIRNTWERICLTIVVCLGAVVSLSSCATTKEQPKTALINDPDSQNESTIPWNKPAKWESGANLPGGLGGIGGGSIGDPGLGN
jgi:hypothetical protein